MPGTIPDSEVEKPGRSRPIPGMLVVFSAGKPLYHPVVLKRGVAITLGREGFGGLALADQKMSSRHAELKWDGGFSVTDLESKNGTFLDGEPVRGVPKSAPSGVLRIGQTVVLLLADVNPFTRGELSTTNGMIAGPTLQRVLDQASRARKDGAHLLIRGESGSGKELVTQTFHRAASNPGPLVSCNCANLQPGLAEAALFGTVKGAFSDARDADGLFLEADGGVLFLDEIAELDLQVQAKLLRAVETGKIARVGDSRTKSVKVTVVAASHQRLKERVTQGRFREDLLYRLAQFEVQLPPLRERPEEFPWLMQLALEGRGETLDSSFVEAALLRPWPGNVRELLSATRAAATAAREKGESVKARHLDAEAGVFHEPESAAAPVRGAARPEDVTKEMVIAMLAECDGNATKAAERLRLHRTQLFRLRKEFGLS